MNNISDVTGYELFVKFEVIPKGWSSDKKYYIETLDGQKLLLRTSDISEYDRKKTEFELMKQVSDLGIPMSRPLNFGVCNDGKNVYILLTWCNGDDAEKILPQISETDQYMLGLKSGKILKKIHAIKASEMTECWFDKFNRKTNIKIQKYLQCGEKFIGDEWVIEYIEANRHLLNNRPQCYQHGDYHVGNMIVSPEGTLSIIDFNRPDFGDPWEEFNRIVWSSTVSPHFATGQLVGYFDGRPPEEFFKLLAFYISSNALSSIYWAIPFGQEEVDIMMKQSKDILAWFDNMKNPVPSWYIENFYVPQINDVP